MPGVRVRIHGRVQGVGYRAWTQAEARRLGLSGWVRNRSDGTVEAVFSGEAEAVEAMLERCGHGPALAAVEAIERFPLADPPPAGFTQRRTA